MPRESFYPGEKNGHYQYLEVLIIYVKPFKDSSEADASEGYQKVLKRGLLETFRQMKGPA